MGYLQITFFTTVFREVEDIGGMDQRSVSLSLTDYIKQHYYNINTMPWTFKIKQNKYNVGY